MPQDERLLEIRTRLAAVAPSPDGTPYTRGEHFLNMQFITNAPSDIAYLLERIRQYDELVADLVARRTVPEA